MGCVNLANLVGFWATTGGYMREMGQKCQILGVLGRVGGCGGFWVFGVI